METKYCSFDDLPLTLRVENLMPILGIGRNTSIRIGRQIRAPKDAVENFLKQNSGI